MDIPLPVTKPKKKKTLQIMYPAPYSQSWEPDVMPVLMKKNVGGPRGPNLLCRTKRADHSSRTWSQQFPDRPDPTAPHLKYGVFRNRRGSTTRSLVPKPDIPKPDIPPKMERFAKLAQPKGKPAKPTKDKRSTAPIIRIPREPTFSYSSCSSAIHEKPAKRQENSRYQPVFVSRTINESYCRKLCLSNIMHVDIKPKRAGTFSPTFYPGSYFRNSPRKSTIAPVRKRHMRDLIHAIP